MVADLASLIARVQASLAMIESAVAGEAADSLQGLTPNVVVLDEITPRYLKAGAALQACDSGLGIALDFLREPTTSGLGLHDPAWNHYPPRTEPIHAGILKTIRPSEAGFDPGRYRFMPARKCGAREEGVKICRAGRW